MKRLFLFVFCGMLCAASCSEKADGIVASGTAGPLKWTLSKDGTLTISGKGEMPDYSFYSYQDPPPPWVEYHDDITGVIIDNGISNIGGEAFCYCSKMTYVTISKSVTGIGHRVFKECSSLKSVDIPHSVTAIGVLAFQSCTGLTSATIGNSVVTIGEEAFRNCSNLTEIVNHREAPQLIIVKIFQGISSNPFAGVDTNYCSLSVPAGSMEAYRSANVWKDFKNIKAIQ